MDKEHSTGDKNGRWQSTCRRALSHAWTVLKQNWPYKVTAVVIAVALWAGLITQDPSLTREKTFSDVTINVSGTDTLKRNGYIMVSDLSSQLTGTLTADVPQTQYQNVQASNFNPRIDLSRIRSAGEQTVSVSTTNSSAYGTVTAVSPSEIVVEVEPYQTRYRIPVIVMTEGSLPEGFWSTVPAVDPQIVVVSGPGSVVRRIARATAVLDLSATPRTEGVIYTAVPITLVDADGEPIENDLIEVTSESVLLDSVLISQSVYSARSFPLSDAGVVLGKPAPGYEIKSITTTPAQVTLAGLEEDLKKLDSVYVMTPANAENQTETFQSEIRLRRPSEAVSMSSDTATVVVEIGPVITSRTFERVRLSITGLESGMAANLLSKTVDVTVTGEQLEVEALKAAQLRAVVDLSGLTETGTYELPVALSVSGAGKEFTLTAAPAAVKVEVTGR